GEYDLLKQVDVSKQYTELKAVLDDIRALNIQGATNVAIAGVEAFAHYAYDVSTLFSDKTAFFHHLDERSEEIKSVRITEPALQNGLTYVKKQISEFGIEAAKTASVQYKSLLESAKKMVGKIGSEKIMPNATIMTHCHSSFVDEVFAQAKAMGKSFRVVNTETRPLYQGRKTVKKLLQHDIEVIHVVDSAMWWAMQKFDVDLIIIGADAVTVEGVTLNKIGSRLLALSSRELHVPLYVCTSLLKYNPATSLGRLSEIEMRASEEVWSESPKGFKIYNPAFETISRHFISAYITEFGIVPPQLVSHFFETRYINDLFTKKK
ncbi:MAG TPA: translation initiation factor eIF-2B, partial [Candidatus Hodarchaeales archaeon]|nr:translation initiation factor eIF-2B [Candidatus Hodarchaeales archaeon]